MSDGLLVQVDDADIQALLDNTLAALENPEPLLRTIGETIRVNVAGRLASNTDPTGAPWAPLAEATLARKKGRGSTLVDSGDMRRSLTYNLGSDYVEIGFGEPYAQYHETGTERMPRRGLLLADIGFSDDGDVSASLGEGDRQDILDDVFAYLRSAGL